MKQKLLTLMTLLVMCVTGAWADTELFSTNFSTADGWSTSTDMSGSGSITIKGTTISYKDGGSVAATASSGKLTFGSTSNITDKKTNVSELDHYIAIPVTGVVGGQVTVTTVGGNTNFYYCYSDGSTNTCTKRAQGSTKDIITITGLASTSVTIYIGSKDKSMTKLTVTTPETADLSSNLSYTFYNSSSTAAADLISAASLPSYVNINNCTNTDNGTVGTIAEDTPIDFSSLSGSYYRLKPATSSSIVIGGLSKVKSIRVYGNGSGSTGNMVTTVSKISGSGTAMTVTNKAFVNAKANIAEYSTGDLTALTGYDRDTYYLYTITFSANFSLWGLYIEYAAPAGPSITAQSIADASYVQGTAAENVTALSVTASASAGTLTYQWYKNTANSTTTPIPTAITGAESSSYKPLTTAAELGDLYYFCKVTDSNSSVYSNIAKITVSEASAPTAISVTPSATNAARGVDAITFTAEVTGGVPTPTIEWFKCDDTSKTNPVSQGEASAANTTFDVATTTVGTYYYFAKASNATGNVESAVQTITIVPKAPTITASGTFTDSKDVTITKADGEDASAVIKYSVDNGENWSDFTSLNVTETTTVKAKVVQAGLESAEVTATYTKITLDERMNVTGSASWDWSKFRKTGTSDIVLTASTTPAKDAEFVLSNAVNYGLIDEINENFGNAQQLSVSGEYVVRDNTYFQGPTIKFYPTVPGILRVKYSSTGTKDSNKRYLAVNNVACSESMKSTTATWSDKIPVAANTEVIIKGVQDGDEPTASAKYLRFFALEFTETVPVTVTANKYATFSSTKKVDLTDVEGLTAYKAVSPTETSVTLEEVIGIVPAETGLLLYANVDANTTYNIPVSTADATADITGNKLVSTASAAHDITSEEYGKAFVFGLLNGTVGFVKAATGKTVGAGKCYLLFDEAPAKDVDFLSLGFDEENETNGIGSIENGKLNIETSAYNLAGQKVDAAYKGIVIVNGKKVVRK